MLPFVEDLCMVFCNPNSFVPHLSSLEEEKAKMDLSKVTLTKRTVDMVLAVSKSLPLPSVGVFNDCYCFYSEWHLVGVCGQCEDTVWSAFLLLKGGSKYPIESLCPTKNYKSR